MTIMALALRTTVLWILFPGRTEAQVVRGRVIDEATRAPLSTVEVIASGPGSARAVSDSAGFFRLDLPTSGSYTITAERIGYVKISQPLVTTMREDLVIEIKLAPTAIPLEPLTIVGRTNVSRSGLDGFYQRAEWSEKLGLGTILQRKDIEKRAASRTAHVLASLGGGIVVRGDTIGFRRGGRPCRPEVFTDGVRGIPGVIDVEIQSVEGIEIYRGPSQVPAQFSDRNGCGSVLIWTRRAEPSNRPFRWKHLAIGAGLVLGVILLAR